MRLVWRRIEAFVEVWRTIFRSSSWVFFEGEKAVRRLREGNNGSGITSTWNELDWERFRCRRWKKEKVEVIVRGFVRFGDYCFVLEAVLLPTFEINSCCHHALRRSPKFLALRSLRWAAICRVRRGSDQPGDLASTSHMATFHGASSVDLVPASSLTGASNIHTIFSSVWPVTKLRQSAEHRISVFTILPGQVAV